MAYTMQQVLDRARSPLNDSSKRRYPDAKLLEYANDAVRQLRQKRPDLFFGQFEALPGDKALGENLPLDDDYMPVVCDYIRARAETKDDDAALQSKAVAYFALFKDGTGAG